MRGGKLRWNRNGRDWVDSSGSGGSGGGGSDGGGGGGSDSK